MSRTRKDAAKSKDKVLEVVKRDDGKFDLFLNRELDRAQVPEASIESWLGRFGYCQDEYDSIMREVHQNGRAAVYF